MAPRRSASDALKSTAVPAEETEETTLLDGSEETKAETQETEPAVVDGGDGSPEETTPEAPVDAPEADEQGEEEGDAEDLAEIRILSDAFLYFNEEGIHSSATKGETIVVEHEVAERGVRLGAAEYVD